MTHPAQDTDSRDLVDWALMAPLFNFSSSIGRVKLHNDIVLAELHEFFPQLHDAATGKAEPWRAANGTVVELLAKVAPLGTHIHSDMTHGVGTLLKIPKGQSPDLGEAITTFDDVIASLRLVKRGAVYFPCVLTYPVMEGLSNTLNLDSALVLSSGANRALLTVEGECYTLLEHETTQLQRIHSSLNANFDQRVDFALRRFDLSYERSRQEDRLVDLFIALEALFMSASQRRELRAQLSYRIAWFLGESFDEIQSLHSTVKMLYRVRSDVVHGSVAENLAPPLARTEDLVRKSLRRAVVDPASLNAVRERQLGSGNGHPD